MAGSNKLVLVTKSCIQCQVCGRVRLSSGKWMFFDIVIITGYDEGYVCIEEDICDGCHTRTFNEQSIKSGELRELRRKQFRMN